MGKQTKSGRSYEGILAQPLPIRSLAYAVDDKPWNFEISDQEWAALVEKDTRLASADLEERWDALSAHYEVDRTSKFCWADLAVCLAIRHELDWLERDGGNVGKLYERLKVVRDSSPSDYLLACSLAIEHVPGFRERPEKVTKTTLTDDELEHLTWCLSLIIERVGATKSTRQLQRKVLDVLLSPKLLSAAVGEESARRLEALFRRKARSGTPIDRPAIRRWIREISSSVDTIARNSASSLQLQIQYSVLPRMQRRLLAQS